jgi:hypothetical protein
MTTPTSSSSLSDEGFAAVIRSNSLHCVAVADVAAVANLLSHQFDLDQFLARAASLHLEWNDSMRENVLAVMQASDSLSHQCRIIAVLASIQHIARDMERIIQRSFPWNRLPEQIPLLILAFLDTPTLIQNKIVCREWKNSCTRH